MRRILIAITIIGLASALPVLAADDDSPFRIDKRDFRKQFKTIALSPIDADASFNMPDTVAQTIEQEVTRHLEKRGYTVLPTSVLGDIRAQMEAQVGGLTDPDTGRIDPAKMQAVRTHAFREMWFRHEIDAVATIRVEMSRAQFEDDRAEWDGVRQKVESKGRNRGYAGTIVASSVSFAVFDQSDRLMYVNYGGLEVLQSRNEAQLLPVPVEQYFSDEKKIRKAAQIAMDPI